MDTVRRGFDSVFCLDNRFLPRPNSPCNDEINATTREASEIDFALLRAGRE